MLPLLLCFPCALSCSCVHTPTHLRLTHAGTMRLDNAYLISGSSSSSKLQQLICSHNSQGQQRAGYKGQKVCIPWMWYSTEATEAWDFLQVIDRWLDDAMHEV